MNKNTIFCLRRGCQEKADDEYACNECLGAWCSRACARIDAGHKETHGHYYKSNITSEVMGNSDRLRFLFEDPSGHVQLGVSSVDRGKIDWEQHPDMTQVIVVVSGSGYLRVKRPQGKYPSTLSIEERKLTAGDIAVVPAKMWHEISSKENDKLKFYTIYSKDSDKKWQH